MRLDELEKGSVVRLKSGSIKFVVERIWPNAQDTVALVGWHERCGTVRFSIHHACLVWPKNYPPGESEDEPD